MEDHQTQPRTGFHRSTDDSGEITVDLAPHFNSLRIERRVDTAPNAFYRETDGQTMIVLGSKSYIVDRRISGSSENGYECLLARTIHPGFPYVIHVHYKM